MLSSQKVRRAFPANIIIGRLLPSSVGYKQYDTGRTYMALMGDWRENKDEEIELDGIGGVSILVKADVHRSGKSCVLCVLVDAS